MAETEKAKRVLLVKISTPSADATTLLTTMMKNTLPMYQALADTRVRLLRNADNRAQFLQVIEYQTDQTFELNRQKLASDPLMHNYLQAWRTLFPGGVEIDVYEEITENP
jgi:uncharacterized membrane-anchored protein YhcB (DUF1043 family)